MNGSQRSFNLNDSAASISSTSACVNIIGTMDGNGDVEC